MGTYKRMEVREKNEISYDVIYNHDIFSIRNRTIKDLCGIKKCLVVISNNVKNIYYKRIQAYFEAHCEEEQYKIICIPTGEKNKNLTQVVKICSEGKEFELDRIALIIGVGGGVLLDMVGFAASMYRRKIDYIRIPTTLVGQIDAGIGIKTGINFEDSKNFLGAFYPPTACINDIKFLQTLPSREIKCGLSEIIKMAIIKNKDLFESIELYYKHFFLGENINENCDSILSISYMATVDMLEELSSNLYEYNLRRLVDFGHTFSPYIEEKSNYTIKHGEAVALDMSVSTEIAYLKNKITKGDRNRILDLLKILGLAIYDDIFQDVIGLYTSLYKIILHRGKKLNLVIPSSIGKGTFIEDMQEISKELLEEVVLNLKEYQYN